MQVQLGEQPPDVLLQHEGHEQRLLPEEQQLQDELLHEKELQPAERGNKITRFFFYSLSPNKISIILA